MADSDLAELGFLVNTGGLKKGERALNKYADTGEKTEMRTKASSESIGRSYAKLTGVIGTVIASAASLGKILSISREFDVLNAQLVTATGSAENAVTAFDAIQQFAATTPYDIGQATRAFTQLVNLGLTPSEAALVSYGNTASAMGKDLSQMVEAVADATVGEFERLKEFGIKSKTEGDNVSFTFRGVRTTVKKEAAEIEGYLMDLGKNEFAGAMGERAKTLDGQISNLGDSWDSLFRTVSGMGVGDAMKDSVVVAIGAIEGLDNYLASGAFTNSLAAVGGRFDGFARDAVASMNIISAVIGESANGWTNSIGSFFGNMMTGFKQLPEMTRFFIQLAAVNLSKLVSYAGVYGDAFAEIIGVRFDRIVEESKLAGEKIAYFMNPFADEQDYSGANAAITKKFADREDAVIEKAKQRMQVLDDVAESVINNYALEGVAATTSYKEQIKVSDQLLANYMLEKKATSGDRLSQFKIVADTADLAASGISHANVEYDKWVTSVEESTGKIDKLRNEIIETYMAIDDDDLSKATGLEYIDQLRDRISLLKGEVEKADIFGSMTDSIKDSLGAIQGLSAQGSKEYAKLGVAIQAVNVIQAIGAVLNQGNGDPYSAFGRMAAMAGAVVGLVGSIGSMQGGFSDSSGENQAAQGLTVWGDKSDSISKSIDSTASATDKLVDINSNMLTALEAMSVNISNAANLSLRGGLLDGADVSNSIVDNVFTGLIDSMTLGVFDGIFAKMDPLMSAIGGFLGGSSKTTDQGIQITGGMLGDLLNDTEIKSFAEVEYKKWKYGSTKTKTVYGEMAEASTQFALVFSSLADSVYEGAMLLGLGGDEVTAAINSFEVETQKISLKGLSAEDQQSEIEAVFSSIFDGLAGEVVPFIDQFQQVGEGLGETLARVASQVSITEVLVGRLGVTMSDKLANPELFAQISDNLATMTGGIEEFANKTSSFIDDFAPDSVKFEIAFDGITSALNAVGLSLPETSAGFYELMQGLDATTDAGQDQIAALLNSQGLAGDYYDLLDDTVGAFNDTLLSLTSTIESTIDGMFGVTYDAAIGSLDDALMLARAGSFDAAIGLDYGGLSANASDFSSALDFNIAQAKTGNKLSELAALTGSQKTTADLALNESINQTELLASLKKQQEELAVTMVAVQQATIATAEKLQEFQLDSMPVRVVT